MIKRVGLPAVFPALILCLSAPASAQDSVADFYRGKQLRFVVGSAVGGAYDLYARAVARQIVHHIPGNPTLIVQNQPAAGGMVMTNQLYSQGPKDGTAIGVPLNGIPTAPMLQAGAQFDSTRLNWLGSINREAYVGFVWHTVPVAHISEMATKEVLVGSTTVGATMSDFPLLLNDLLGYKFKVVRGYQGTPQINLAIERGEIQGTAGVGWASVKALTQNWIDEKKIRILVQYNVEPSPELPGVPLVMSLARTDTERLAMRLLFARTEYARPYFLPPGVPAERVEALRRAFDATMKDPAFLAEAAKLQLEVSPMTGEAVQALVGELVRTPPAIASRVRSALEAPAK
jgi:tripartite-type tricarboxylate transporter receptor subunit TctC